VTTPPERIELPDVGAALRRHTAADLDVLYAVVEENRDHLRPFMPWADQTRDDLARFLTETIASWDAGTSWQYVIVDARDDTVLGGCGLLSRIGPGALEIGYWLRQEATGRGVVTASARALTDAALAVDGVARVEIHCDAANIRSAAVASRLGYRLDRIEDDDVTAPGDVGRSMIWVWPP
jgi:RimJ/RimL family protein N-acetyltransferase